MTEKKKTEKTPETPGSRWWRRFAKNLGGAPRTREDLLELLAEAGQNQLLDADGMGMVRRILESDQTQARDVMIPRAQIVSLERGWSLEQIIKTVTEAGHSRYPVTGDSKDEVVGVLLAKDLLRFASDTAGEFDITRLIRPVKHYPESTKLRELLKEFKRGRNHMAMVVDEYGGVAGVLTIEDVLEEIVGEIADEYDEAEAARIQKQDERRFLVNALATVEEFNSYFSTELPVGEFDTIGGLVLHHFGRMPRRGESVKLERFSFNVQKADSRRVQQFLVTLGA